jgi:hypothetical protein
MAVYFDAAYSPVKVKAVKTDSVRTDSELTMQFAGTVNGSASVITLDSGASHCFVNSRKVEAIGLIKIPDHRVVELADGSFTAANASCQINVRIKAANGTRYRKVVNALVVDLGPSLDVILGDDWLRSERAVISYEHTTCTIKSRKGSLTVLKPIPLPHETDTEHQPMLNAIQMKRLVRKGAKLFMVNVIDTGLHPYVSATDCYELHDPELEDRPKVVTLPDNLSARVRKVLERYRGVFQDSIRMPDQTNVLPEVIELIPGSKPVFRPSYRLSPAERQEVEKQVAELLRKGLIEPSSSPWGSPIVFATKPDGTLRFTVDYRLLNNQTVPMKGFHPRADDMFDQLQGCSHFSSMDLVSGYWQLPLHVTDIPKTQFIM